MDKQTERHHPWHFPEEQEAIDPNETIEKTSRGLTTQLKSLSLASPRRKRSLSSSDQQEEKERERQLLGPGIPRGETSTFRPVGHSRRGNYTVEPGKIPASHQSNEAANMFTKSENDPEKAVHHPISKEETEVAQIPELPEPAPSTHPTCSDGLFDVNDINAAAAILTVISDICKLDRIPSSQDQAELRAIFEQMPYLLTCKGREESPELAIQFLISVYDNPQSATWGGIESFDHLQLMLESLKKFENRAQAQPREEQEGCFVI
ncbi:hypothetical protein FSARC_8593 [Fusarium sarcochroum]|uniref:Uncharacterized protein n=1 Tax=Fusarium sarcochroum TaxID=1208366 RepID=A0A8H4X704_9HYPO|nr:hypothetical protein FSARC_8593 [Fusarium sarcochroum]